MAKRSVLGLYSEEDSAADALDNLRQDLMKESMKYSLGFLILKAPLGRQNQSIISIDGR